jgi:hypothetical protein
MELACQHWPQIVQRDDQFVTLVDDYRRRLRRLITNMSDYLSRQTFPDTWPASLNEFQVTEPTIFCSGGSCDCHYVRTTYLTF